MGVEITCLDNGLNVLTHAMPHIETVALGIWVKAGARDERPEENGIAHFLEHMAFKGTKRRTAKDIAEALSRQHGSTIDTKRLALEKPIKELGEYVLTYKPHPEVPIQLKVSVVAQE